MALASYGRPTIPIDDFLEVVGDELVFRDTVPERFQFDQRWPEHEQAYADLAASAQAALEYALLWLARRLRSRIPSPRLCYTGGVALNSVANERLVREAGFEDVFIMPASEDSGTAIGAAYHALTQVAPHLGGRRMHHDSVGRVYAPRDTEAALARYPALVRRRPIDPIDMTADLLAAGQIVGWFDGASELGPRALGQRSIFADPRRADMKDRLNARVKFREAFRPYAPAVLLEHVHEWFDAGGHAESPFMLRVMPVLAEQRERIPAVVHVDGTARVQTVTVSGTPRLHAVLTAFYKKTGVPVLLETSLNVAGEPIVETPEEALCVLQFTELDACVLDGSVIVKSSDRPSPLDLCPVLLCESVSIERVVTPGGMRTRAPRRGSGLLAAASAGQAAQIHEWASRYRMDHVRIVVNGRHGRVVRAASMDVLPVLQAIDGRRTGWAVLDRLNRRGRRFTQPQLLALLRAFASAGIVAFRAGAERAVAAGEIARHDRLVVPSPAAEHVE
jgi:carbamoyltransferase